MKQTGTVLTLVVLVAAIVVVGVLIYSGGGATDDAAGRRPNTIDAVQRRGTLRVGFSTFVPWAMKNSKGEYIGFEIDVARKLAEDMGVDLELVPTEWAGIIPALQTGRFDVIIGGMGITPERNLKVNFSIPYNHGGMGIVASRSKAPGRTRLEAFDNPQTIVAVRLGTTAHIAARKHLPRAQLKTFDDEAQALQEVLSGNAHAFVTSAPLPRIKVADHPDQLYLPVQETFTSEPQGFAVVKGDHDALNYFNNWIRYTEAQGWLEERRRYWFGSTDWRDRLD